MNPNFNSKKIAISVIRIGSLILNMCVAVVSRGSLRAIMKEAEAQAALTKIIIHCLVPRSEWISDCKKSS